MITAMIYTLVTVTEEQGPQITLDGAIPYGVVMAITGVAVYWGRALVDRRKISAVADKDEASAAEVVSKAAAQLVNPLRLELETVRGELAALKVQTTGMATEIHTLTMELGTARRENTTLQQENARLRLELQANGNGEKK